MASRRFLGLINGYSQRLANQRAAVTLWVDFYNLSRVHETLRGTPAMTPSVTDHIGTIAERVPASRRG